MSLYTGGWASKPSATTTYGWRLSERLARREANFLLDLIVPSYMMALGYTGVSKLMETRHAQMRQIEMRHIEKGRCKRPTAVGAALVRVFPSHHAATIELEPVEGRAP